MVIDVTRNVVAFRLGPETGHIVAADAPTRADDSVKQAWEKVCREHGARAGEVVALESEWEPSAADKRFIVATFPQAEVCYNFGRPTGNDWNDAFQAARDIMQEQQTRRAADDPERATDDGELLPVLWSASSPGATPLDTMPNWELIRGRLFWALANVALTGRGTIGMSHLTWARYRELGSPDKGEVLDEAFTNLKRGLHIKVAEVDEGRFCQLERPGSLAAAAVLLPDLHEQLSEHLGSGKLLVGLPSQDQLFVAAAGSPPAQKIKQWVLSEGHPVRQLLPTVLSLHRGKLKLVAERA